MGKFKVGDEVTMIKEICRYGSDRQNFKANCKPNEYATIVISHNYGGDKGSVRVRFPVGNHWKMHESELQLVKGGKKMEQKPKEYPGKFYVQRCMENDDPTDLYIHDNPEKLDMNHPMLEITYSKKNGFKIRQVKLTAETVITVKEVK